jgi:hypothetical protein
MQTYPAGAHHFQSERQFLANTIFAWLKCKVEAHRERQAGKQALEHLQALDRHFLDDVGVDITMLEESRSKLENSRPFRLPVNMSSR